MMTFVLVSTVILSVIMIMIGWINVLNEDIQPKKWTPFLQVVLAAALVLCVIYISNGSCRETTYKKALIDNPYEMKVLYDVESGTIVPYDTIYLLKQ